MGVVRKKQLNVIKLFTRLSRSRNTPMVVTAECALRHEYAREECESTRDRTSVVPTVMCGLITNEGGISPSRHWSVFITEYTETARTLVSLKTHLGSTQISGSGWIWCKFFQDNTSVRESQQLIVYTCRSLDRGTICRETVLCVRGWIINTIKNMACKTNRQCTTLYTSVDGVVHSRRGDTDGADTQRIYSYLASPL